MRLFYNSIHPYGGAKMPLYRKNCIDSVFMHNACNDPKGGSCIPWNPTSSREAHENVFIRNDLPLMCRGLFPHCCVLWGRIKP